MHLLDFIAVSLIFSIRTASEQSLPGFRVFPLTCNVPDKSLMSGRPSQKGKLSRFKVLPPSAQISVTEPGSNTSYTGSVTFSQYTQPGSPPVHAVQREIQNGL